MLLFQWKGEALESVFAKLRDWFRSQKVPEKEIDQLLNALAKFFNQDWRDKQGQIPSFAAYASKRRYHRTHATFSVTWSNCTFDNIINSETADNIGRRFSDEISRIERLPHIRAHLTYFPWPALEGKTIDDWLQSRTNNKRGIQTSDAHFIAGYWSQEELVTI